MQMHRPAMTQRRPRGVGGPLAFFWRRDCGSCVTECWEMLVRCQRLRLTGFKSTEKSLRSCPRRRSA